MAPRMHPLLPVHALMVAHLAGTVGCQKFASVGDAYALQFNGDSSCATAEVDSALWTEQGTVEAWVQADPNATYVVHPLIVWNGAFALWSDAEDQGYFTDTATDPKGASYSSGWMDGEVHHVAGTWDAGTVQLFLDGERKAFNTSNDVGIEVAGSINVGCWGTKGFHDGLVDEIRISSTVRYTDDFDAAQGPFVSDEDTVVLWHADEGDGPVALDSTTHADLQLENVDWTVFKIEGGAVSE